MSLRCERVYVVVCVCVCVRDRVWPTSLLCQNAGPFSSGVFLAQPSQIVHLVHWHLRPGFFSSGTEEKKQVQNSAACRYKLQPEAAVASLSLLATDTSECHQVSPALPSVRATYCDVCSPLLPAAGPAPLFPLV